MLSNIHSPRCVHTSVREVKGSRADLDPLASGGIDNRISFAHCATVDAYVSELSKPALF